MIYWDFFAFFVVMFAIAPFMIIYLHNLNVIKNINLVQVGKDMIQGLMPYHDMPMKESPIGIVILGLLYTILGIEASSYWASCLLCITNI